MTLERGVLATAFFLACLSLPQFSQSQIVTRSIVTDPKALEKLAAGQLERVNTSDRGMLDLSAILQGLIAADCKYQARVGDPPVSLPQMLQRIVNSGSAMGPLIVAHPAYGETLFFVSLHGCPSEQVQRVMRTLFAALMAPPPPPQPEANLVEPRLHAQEIKKWWAFSWGEPNPGGRFEATLGDAKILLCHYNSPSNYSPITRIAWYDAPPATSLELRRLKATHPIGKVGNVRLEKCPGRISEFDAARTQAGS